MLASLFGLQYTTLSTVEISFHELIKNQITPQIRPWTYQLSNGLFAAMICEGTVDIEDKTLNDAWSYLLTQLIVGRSESLFVVAAAGSPDPLFISLSFIRSGITGVISVPNMDLVLGN